MRRDYEHARQWIASYVESECSITSQDKVLRALSDLASGENEEEEGVVKLAIVLKVAAEIY